MDEIWKGYENSQKIFNVRKKSFIPGELYYMNVCLHDSYTKEDFVEQFEIFMFLKFEGEDLLFLYKDKVYTVSKHFFFMVMFRERTPNELWIIT